MLTSRTVAIIVIVAIVVAVYVVVNNKNNSNKRSVEVRGIAWGGEAPVAQVYAQSKIVVPGVPYDEGSDAPLAKFASSAKVRGMPPKAQRRYVKWTPEDLLGSDDK